VFQFNSAINTSQGYEVAGTNVITSGAAIQNVTGFTQSTGAFAFSGGGNFSLNSAGLDVTTAGAVSGVTTLGLSGTQTFSGAATDITTASNESLTLIANGTGVIDLNDAVAIGSTLTVAGITTVSDDILATNTGLGVTGTTLVAGTNTASLTLTADVYNVGDVVYIDNAGQDYYTRIINDFGLGAYTVSPTVSYDISAPTESRSTESIGSSVGLKDRFFEGYFLGGIVVGAGSTSISDGNISRTTGDITITPGAGGQLEVAGTLNATNITGNGSGITNIDSSAISGATITALNASNISSGTLADARLTSNVTLLGNSFNGINQLLQLNASGNIPALNGALITSLNAGNLTGALAALDGSALTSLNATNLSSGTVADARLSSNVATLTGTQSFSGLKTFGAGATITTGQTFTVNGDDFTDLTGTGLTISSGALSVAYGSTASTSVQGNTALTCPSGTGNLSGGGTAITLGAGGTCAAISTNNAVSFSTSVTSPSYTTAGATAMTIDTGGAAGVTIAGTNANSLALGNSSNQTTINGSTIVLGTSTIRRTSAGSTTLELNDSAADTTFSITNTDVTRVANMTIEGLLSAASVSGSGSGLTALSGSNIASGTVADTYLSSNVATLSGAQTFSGLKTFDAGLTVGAAQNFTINSESFTDLTGTGLAVSSGVLGIDTTYFDSNYIKIGGATIQTDNSTNSSIGVNKTGASGNLIELQKSGVEAFTVNV
jgi:hypothetical protein